MQRLFLSLVTLLVFACAAFAKSHFVILGGLGGETAYGQRFAEQVDSLEEICERTAGEGTVVHALQGEAATRDGIVALLEKLRDEAVPTDTVILVLIGHGTFDGYEYRFNIPGPDLTASRLQKLLDAIASEQQLVVNTTSASGAMLDALKSDRRVVVTATKSGYERTITVFAQYWLEALEDPAADIDKNETITALEAFRYAEDKVKAFYESEKKLATEHARLEGDLAASFALTRLGTALQASADPTAGPLLARRDELEREIGQLRQRKDEMESDDYERQLEKLLIELAQLQAQIDSLAEKN